MSSWISQMVEHPASVRKFLGLNAGMARNISSSYYTCVVTIHK